MDRPVATTRSSITSALGCALLAAVGLLCGGAADSHEDRELRDRGHELRSERRETREERKVREREERRALKDARGEANTSRLDSAIASTQSQVSGSSTSGSNSGSAALPEQSDDDDSGSGSDHDSADDRDDSDADSHDEHRDDDRAQTPLARIDIERDTQGHERVREEVLMVADTAAIGAVRAAGFMIVEERTLDSLGEVLARIRVRTGVPLEQTILELQALAPRGSVAPHDVFRPSADAAFEEVARESGSASVPRRAHVGVVDTGVDHSLAALATAIVAEQGFVDGRSVPRMHGTVVAEIVALGGARLSVADVFGVDADNRLIAPAAAIAAAIDWLVARHVRVINISIEGPNNLVLAYVIHRALAADVAIVAAAGNGGPAAEPAFPAAYPGVIAVTAVDEHGQVYRRANRGDYIAFAARGVRITTQWQASEPRTVSGTSFAAPVVATILAHRLAAASAQHVSDVVSTLRQEARDLGAPGPDTTYGWGELALPQVRTASSR